MRPDHLKRAASPLLLTLVLAGCSLVPPYERPAAPVSTDWPVATDSTAVTLYKVLGG